MRVCGSNRRNRQKGVDFEFTAQQSQKAKSANRLPTGERKSADLLLPEWTRDDPQSRDPCCDNASTMPDDDRPAEIFPIAYSTAYLCLAALITIRTNEDGDHDDNSVEYATRVLELVKAQPETVLTLPPDQLEETGPSILSNSRAWLN